ncbi:ATP-binding protein [Fusobacterium polymorphum]|uniref:ATP-binding protein n=1 Tax=Fusobacterium nucleatum subsp. polymorphum TaxID=76857 RepID=UPI0030D370FD
MIKAISEIASVSNIKKLEIPDEEIITNKHSKILGRCKKCKEVIRYKTNKYEFMRDCKCMRKYRVEAKLDKFKNLSITDRNFKSDIFMNAKIDKNGAEAELYRKIKNYVKGFDEVLKLNDGLLFKGNCGTGKTFLANCICNFLIDKGYAVLSFKLADYLRVLREDFEKKTGLEGKLLEAIKEADMLFIDDLGSEKLSEDWGKEKLCTLIDTRYSARKPILITTNLTATEMVDFLRYKNTDKILDRINQMTKTFDFTWETKRKPNKKSFWES